MDLGYGISISDIEGYDGIWVAVLPVGGDMGGYGTMFDKRVGDCPYWGKVVFDTRGNVVFPNWGKVIFATRGKVVFRNRGKVVFDNRG